MKSVYTCEDYKIENRVLIIWKPVLIGLVNNVDQFDELIKDKMYNAVICPDLYASDAFNNFDYVVFK